MSEEHKRKIALAHIGMKASPETLKNMSKGHKGNHYSPETEFKKGIYQGYGFEKGERSTNFKGYVTGLSNLLRNSCEYVNWRKKIFKLNDYTCQKCNHRGGDLVAHHHKKSFSKMRQEFLELYNQFSPLEDKGILYRIAQGYAPFWDLNNGITLCIECHKGE